ncbi:MAG: hydrolase, partial [Flavobacteriaceae bacterium]|nr:hydrolase [Flavobacteriaceae bacterium]
EVGEGFNPEVGFLLRSAYKKPEGLILYHLRPKKPDAKILEYRPHVSYRGYWNFDGFQETGFLHIDNHWEYKNGMEIHTGVNITREGVVNAFDISDGVTIEPGTYDHVEGQLIFFTNRSKPLSISTRSVIGGSFGGSRYLNSATLRYRHGDKLNTEVGYQYNKFDLPGGTFSANIFRGAMAYSFMPNMYLQGLIQNNTVADLWSVNFRFGWLQKANAGLFVVFNANWLNDDPFNNSIIIKYSRMLDLVR